MAEAYFYTMSSTSSSVILDGTGLAVRFIVIDVETLNPNVSIFSAPSGNERIAHAGWIAFGNDLSLTLMEPGLYMYNPVWINNMRQQQGFPDGTVFATHLLWGLEPGVSVNAYVLSY